MLRSRKHLAGLLTLLLAACAAPTLEQRPWIAVRSANFEILTDLSREQAVALSEQLELFRAVVKKLTDAKRFEPRVPTRIFAFAEKREYDPFSPSRYVLGYFRPGLRENTVALDASGSRGMGATHILLHEYTHFLLHNQNQIVLPLWYDEGFAEFMSTVQIGPKSVFIGAAPMERKRSARYGKAITTAKMMRARSFRRFTDPEVGMFYLQAWQAVHYFMLGPGARRGDFGARLARYVGQVERGEDEETAFEANFGMDFDNLHAELVAYNKLPAIPAVEPPRSLFQPDAGSEVRDVPPAEIAEQLGWLALGVQRLVLAESYFEQALASDATRSRAQAGLGAANMLKGRAGQAEADFTRALGLAPDNYENHLDLAASLYALAAQGARPELVPRIREHSQRAIELAPAIPEGYAMLGTSYTLTDEDPTAGIAALERARALLPGELDIYLPLAKLYARAGRKNEARAAAYRVASWSHGDLSDEAKKLLGELGADDEREADAKGSGAAAR